MRVHFIYQMSLLRGPETGLDGFCLAAEPLLLLRALIVWGFGSMVDFLALRVDVALDVAALLGRLAVLGAWAAAVLLRLLLFLLFVLSCSSGWKPSSWA